MEISEDDFQDDLWDLLDPVFAIDGGDSMSVSMARALVDGYDITTVAEAIARFDIRQWDHLGFEVSAKEDALDALGDYASWLDRIYSEWDKPSPITIIDPSALVVADPPIVNPLKYPGICYFRNFWWARDAMPNFAEIEAEFFNRIRRPARRQTKSAETHSRATLLVLIAALSKAAGIDLSLRGAPQRVHEATELLGIAVSADTISRVINEIPDALDRRDKTAR